MAETKAKITSVRDFWNTEACGTHFVERCASDKEFYEKFREQRYRTEWHLPLLVPFASVRGQKILEIGTGNGADGVMFAMNGAIYTGVDLTEAALEATRKHFEVLGLRGVFQQENAERLSFPDESFDMVYSHGVLHHTPSPPVAIAEVWRVLKPGGRAIIMLYHKRSFNYYFRIMLYMRLRVLATLLGRVRRWGADREKVRADELVGLRGNQDPGIWELHYRNFLRRGWAYLKANHFVHHCTDGPECPVAYVFSKGEARALFARFSAVRLCVAHFPLRKHQAWIPFQVEKWLAPRIGWYLFIFATK